MIPPCPSLRCSHHVWIANFNPHIHVLAADGVFDDDGTFTVLPAIARDLLEAWFRTEVLALLLREGLIADVLAQSMLTWRHTPFATAQDPQA